MSAINDELRAISDAASDTLKALLQMAGIVGKPEEHGKVRKLAQDTKKLFNATLDNRNLSLLYKGQRTGFVKCTTQDTEGKEYTAPMKLQLRKKGIGEEGELTAELNAFQVKATTYIAPEVATQLSLEQQNELTKNKFLREPVRINIKGVEKDYLISIDPDLNVAKLRSLDAVKADIQKAGIVNDETINRFVKGEKIEYDAGGKSNVAFYDTINFQFVSRPISVDKAQNFNRTVREDNANDDSVTANYRQAVVFDYEGRNGAKEQRAFMLKNVAQGIPVKELYQHIEKSEIGKGMKIQGLAINEALQKGVKISIQGNDLIDKLNPNSKYVIDLKNPLEATIMRKAFYEATQAHHRATEQLENKQHISLEAKDLKTISTKVIDEKTIKETPQKEVASLSNEQVLNDFVTNLQKVAKNDAHNMSFSDDGNIVNDSRKIMTSLENISTNYQNIIKETNGVVSPIVLKDLTQTKYVHENFESIQKIEQNFKTVNNTISQKQDTKVKVEQKIEQPAPKKTKKTPKI